MKSKTTIIAFCVLAVVSCKKDSTTTPAVKTTEEILTGKTWKADEIRVQLSNNTTTYYKLGVSGTIYDSDSIKFSTNNTGTYYFSGASFATTWNFTDVAKTKMTIIINQPPTPITLYLENIQITELYIKYAQYSSAAGISYLASCTRTPN